MRILKHGAMSLHALSFILFSFAFTYIVERISLGESALSREGFSQFVHFYWPLALLGLIVAIFVWFSRKEGLVLMSLYVLSILYLILSFWPHWPDRQLVVMLALYLSITYFFSMALARELKKSLYIPQVKRGSLGKRSPYGLNVSIILSNGEEQEGHLSNWDEDSAFVILDDAISFKSGTLELICDFEGVSFSEKAQVWTQNRDGIGIKFMGEKESWPKLLEVLTDRGFSPQFSHL